MQTVKSLEERAVQTQKALRIFVRDATSLQQIAGHLNTKGEGQVSFVVIKEDGRREIEVELPQRYRISPQIASALKTARGIVDIELV